VKRTFFVHNFINITLPVLVVVILLGILVVYITMEGSRKTIETINEQTVGRIRESTELMFSEADTQSLNYTVSPRVILRFEELLRKEYTEKEYLDISYMIQGFLDSAVNSKAFLHSIYIFLETDKENFFASSVGLANRLNFRDAEWIDEIKKAPPELNRWLEIRQAGAYANSRYSTAVVSLYKRLYSSGQRKSTGVLVMNIYQDYLISFYRRYLTYPDQSILLLNNDGSVLCKAGALGGKQHSMDLADFKKNQFVSQEKNSAYGITYLSLVPRSTLRLQAEKLMRLVVSAILLILSLGGGLAYFFSHRDARDLQNIIRLLDSAEKGENLPDLRPARDVYGYITQNIIKTFLEKNRLDRQLIEEKYRLEVMQFSLLQSQLNPHFLFNTLKNIFWKAVKLTGHPNDASRMIDLLTGVLHYTLVNRERFVTVAEEIENSRKYIGIQQMRFDYRFTVDWKVTGDPVLARCIKFILQPLIENSISHGLRDKTDGRIVITASLEQERLSFSVTDNGHGFSPERLREIRGQLLQDTSPIEGIGLYNLNKRLILVYGSSAALTIDSVPDTETTIEFSLPIKGALELMPTS
jgi:two-component system sensor histidine kinase YesM